MSKDVRYIEWSDGFKVGLKIIDKQHQHFIGLMDKLFQAMQSNQKDAVPKFIDELIEYANMHFATEADLFKKYNYPAAAEHEAEHEKLKAKVEAFLARKSDDPFRVGYDLLDLLEDWLFKHLVTFDKKYAKFMNSKGLS